jgi:polyhydroxyalkanoate synthesis regulator phasin
MTKRNRLLVLGLVAALAAATVAFVVWAQTGGTEMATSSPRQALLEKVAAALGVEVDALVAAFEKARLEMIDEAVASGRLTEEQVLAMKQGIAARQAMRDVLDQAVADGKITPDQLALLGERRGMAEGSGALFRARRGCSCDDQFMGPMRWRKGG